MTKNKDYWKGRMAALEDDQYRNGAGYYKDVQEQFRRASNSIQMDIERWYMRLAENNGISYAAAKRLLKKGELEEFKWDVQQYIKAGEENAIDRRWMKELENASARHHISYLEAMKLQARQHAELLSTEFEGGMTDFLHKSYADSFYHTAYEMAKGTGLGTNLARLDDKRIDAVVKRPWAQDGASFSDRIWTNKQKLVNRLHMELTQSIIRGESPQKTIDSLARTMDVSRAQAGRLIMTESAAIASAAQKDSLKELGVEQYEILATLDGKTSEICQEMDGKVFDMKDYEVGVTAPPFHPNCRSTTVPYFDDEFTDGEERAARNEAAGKTYYVPANMKYGEWKRQFVEDYDGFRGNDTTKRPKGTPKKLAELDEKHYNAIGERIGRAPDYIQTLIEDHYDEIKYSDGTEIKYGVFRRKSGVIDINFENDAQNPFGSYTVAFHEMGHCIDKQMGNVSERMPDFSKLLKDDTDRFIQEAKKIYQTDDIYDTISKELKQYHPGQSVADLLGATTGNKVKVPGWQHNPDYWKKPFKLEHEAFAHFFEATARCDGDKLEMIQTVFPNAYEAFINAVKVR